MTESDIRPHLATRSFGRHLVLHDSIDSTNTLARTLALQGAPEGTVIVAEEQSAGRGRLGRSWDSQRGKNLTFTILLRPRVGAAALGLLPLAAGVAVCETVRAEGGLATTCKWPNDVLSGSKKLCGILCESVLQGEEVTAAAVGIGLNVNQSSFPPGLETTATSLLVETGHEHDRGRILAAILGRFEALYGLLQSPQTGAIVERWTGCSAMVGRSVNVTGGGRTRDGIVRGVGHDGALLVDTLTGPIAVHAGDVTLREP
jgi:BirA family biotin operon repressor/biotin-[acetyl-CoA-carboxylase] ligase